MGCLGGGLLLAATARGLWRRRDPLRVGLFVAVLIQLVPAIVGSAFTSLPTAGVWMLMTGWALAAAREAERGEGAAGLPPAAPAGLS